MKNTEQDLFEFEEEKSGLTLRDMIGIVWMHKWWFTASLVVCIILAGGYLMWMPNVYTRTASVLIKDSNKGGAAGEGRVFEELNLFNVKSNVDNEVQVFKSTRLMSSVVRKLSLEQIYTTKRGLCTVDLYGISPIRVRFLDRGEDEAATCAVTFMTCERVLLSGFKEENREIEIRWTPRREE